MSGTSADGITAAVAKFSGKSVKVLRHKTYPYSRALKTEILQAANLTTPELSRLNMKLGEAFAKAALKISASDRVKVIGSHGQTVWHGPEDRPPNTLQLGEPAVIAERAKIPVVADFRPGDMASGGQGAPLVPAFDEFLFAQGPLRAVQNIGGVGNLSLVGEGKLWSAFDTGPGNGLMDLAVRLATQGRHEMDKNGRLARQGRPDLKKLEKLLAQHYFHRLPPKSLDKGFFGENYLRKNFGPISGRRLPDILATLSLLTARSIADSCRRFAPRGRSISELVISGGGALNLVLMGHLKELLDPIPVVSSEKYGIPVMAKEAVCFAWLAQRALSGKTNNCPQATGAKGRRVLGKLILPLSRKIK